MISPVKIWRGQKKIQKILGLNGEIISFTKVFAPPVGFETQAPYILIVVKADNGTKYIAQLVDFKEADINIGQKVKAILRRTRSPADEGIIPYGIKFKPL